MTTADLHPDWRAALERFELGYGAAFDASDPLDIAPFMEMLEEQIRSRIRHEIAASFRAAKALLLEELPPRRFNEDRS